MKAINTTTQNIIIMGVPVSRSTQRRIGISHYKPPESAEKVDCEKCKSHTWLGPNQLKAVEGYGPKVKVLCSPCAMRSYPSASIHHLGGQGGTYHMADGNINVPSSGNSNS